MYYTLENHSNQTLQPKNVQDTKIDTGVYLFETLEAQKCSIEKNYFENFGGFEKQRIVMDHSKENIKWSIAKNPFHLPFSQTPQPSIIKKNKRTRTRLPSLLAKPPLHASQNPTSQAPSTTATTTMSRSRSHARHLDQGAFRESLSDQEGSLQRKH